MRLISWIRPHGSETNLYQLNEKYFTASRRTLEELWCILIFQFFSSLVSSSTHSINLKNKHLFPDSLILLDHNVIAPDILQKTYFPQITHQCRSSQEHYPEEQKETSQLRIQTSEKMCPLSIQWCTSLPVIPLAQLLSKNITETVASQVNTKFFATPSPPPATSRGQSKLNFGNPIDNKNKYLHQRSCPKTRTSMTTFKNSIQKKSKTPQQKVSNTPYLRQEKTEFLQTFRQGFLTYGTGASCGWENSV